MSEADRVTSIRQAAAVCNVTPPVVRRWLSLGLITEPPWTLQQLHQIRDETDPQSRRRGPQVAHGTLTRWLEGCDCDECREAQNDASRARFRRKAQKRIPIEMRQQLLDAIYAGYPETGLVVVDALGRPMRPAGYSDRFALLCRDAGVRQVHLHAVRQTLALIMHRAPADAAALLGHTVQGHLAVYVPLTEKGCTECRQRARCSDCQGLVKFS